MGGSIFCFRCETGTGVKIFSQISKEDQSKGNQASESHVTGHQSDGKNFEGPPTEAKIEVPETNPKGLEGSDSVLEVSS